ncbi:MAG: SGNH/GDSL hydrolase family protein [Candidatus Xenobia bacterium]
MTLERFKAGYTRTALGCLNFWVVFFVFNLALLLLLKVVRHPMAPPHAAAALAATGPSFPRPTLTPHDESIGKPLANKHRPPDMVDDIDLQAYIGWKPADLDELLNEWGDYRGAGYRFQPWVVYSFIPVHGKFLNAEYRDGDPEKLVRRSILQSPPSVPADAPVIRVLAFGGSTMFGVFESDQDTVASALWQELADRAARLNPPRRVEVINYGRPGYYSSQELALLQRVLKRGEHPDVVVFLHGLNDVAMAGVRDEPTFTDDMRQAILLRQFGRDWLTAYRWIPMVNFAYWMRGVLSPPPPPPRMPSEAEQAANIVRVYRQNEALSRGLCKAYGVRVYCYLQPNPWVDYDPNFHRRFNLIGLYPIYEDVYAQLKHEPGDVNLSALWQTDYGPHKAYVDNVHYNGPFARCIAKKMADSIDLSGLPTTHPDLARY